MSFVRQNNARIFFACISMLLCSWHRCRAQDSSRTTILEFKGYLKDLQSLGYIDKPDSLSSNTLIHNRLNFKLNLTQHFTATLELRNRVFLGDQVRNPYFSKALAGQNEPVKLSFTWLDRQRIVANTMLDRAYVRYSAKQLDITLGQQRINWGISTIWNPNDIFNAYNFLDFDYDERPGREAARVQYYGRRGAKAELAWKPGVDKNDNIGALMYRFNKHKYDVQVLAGVVQKDYVAGAGWAGNIKDAGFKGEISYFHPINHFSDTAGKLVATLMLDYSTGNNWYFSVATLLNFSSTPASSPTMLTTGPEVSAKNLSPYRYNFYAGAMKTITPIVGANFSVLYSPCYETLVVFPTLSINASQNLDLDLILQSFFAEYNNVYKTLSNTIYFRLKWSFGVEIKR